MATGKVKWFNSLKGFGFITDESQDTDLFVHWSEIKTDGHFKLKARQSVKFDIYECHDGSLHAINVVSQ